MKEHREIKVLITGYHGYISTAMVPMFSKAGHEATGCDSDLYERSDLEAGGGIGQVPAMLKDEQSRGLRRPPGRLLERSARHLNPEVTDDINHRASTRLAAFKKPPGSGACCSHSSCSNHSLVGEMIDETEHSIRSRPGENSRYGQCGTLLIWPADTLECVIPFGAGKLPRGTSQTFQYIPTSVRNLPK
jgi:hypothetical protein